MGSPLARLEELLNERSMLPNLMLWKIDAAMSANLRRKDRQKKVSRNKILEIGL